VVQRVLPDWAALGWMDLPTSWELQLAGGTQLQVLALTSMS
jgi:hypothetical protein